MEYERNEMSLLGFVPTFVSIVVNVSSALLPVLLVEHSVTTGRVISGLSNTQPYPISQPWLQWFHVP